MLALQRQHDHQLCHDVRQLGNASLVKPQKIVQNIHIDEDRMRSVLTLHLLRIPAANRIKLNEQRRRSLSVGVEKNILEESPHEVQVVEAEARGMGLFGEEQDDLSEIISDERLVRVPTEAPEREPNQFLEKQEVLLLVGVELMEGVQLVRGALQSEDEVVGQQLHDVLVERLSLVVVGTVGFN